MNPNSEAVWSASEIMTMKSLIAGHKANNCNNTDIVEELEAQLPSKRKRQVRDFYVYLVVENMNESSNQDARARTSNMVANIAMSVNDLATDNVDMLPGYQMKETGGMGQAEEAPRRQSAPRQERQHTKGYWSIVEHRQFLHGVSVYGRGNWKSISKYCVPTRTPMQISSHAQKYFRKLEDTTRTRRYGINDISLCDSESLSVNKTSSMNGPTFSLDTFIPNEYSYNGQLAEMNNLSQVQPPSLYHASQATTRNSQLADAIADIEQQLMGDSNSPTVPVMQGAGSQIPWMGDQHADFLDDQWLWNLDTN